MTNIGIWLFIVSALLFCTSAQSAKQRPKDLSFDLLKATAVPNREFAPSDRPKRCFLSSTILICE